MAEDFFRQVRRIALTAIGSDDTLMEELVLKGGNALALVHGIDDRASVDLDFSLSSDVPDLQRRLNRTLQERYEDEGYTLFDFSFRPKPSVTRNPLWGGYRVEFKLTRETVEDLEVARRRAVEVAPSHQRRFVIDISKHEYTNAQQEADVDGYTIRVYTPPAIALEKLRAICQQLPDYTKTRTSAPRARDFFDIFRISRRVSLGLDEAQVALAKAIFDAKDVQCQLLTKVRGSREFHRADWPRVEESTAVELEPFDVYFDFVADMAEELHSRWHE